MASITVQLYTTLRNKLVKDKIATDASTVGEALKTIEKRLGREFTEEFYDAHGKIRDHYIVSLNGHPVDRKSPENIEVADNDTLLIYPAVSGG